MSSLRGLVVGVVCALAGCSSVKSEYAPRVSIPSAAVPAERVPAAAPLPPGKRLGEAFPGVKRAGERVGKRAVTVQFDAVPLDVAVERVIAAAELGPVTVVPGDYPSVRVEARELAPDRVVPWLRELVALHGGQLAFSADGVMLYKPEAGGKVTQVLSVSSRLPSAFASLPKPDGVSVFGDDSSRQLVISGKPGDVATVVETVQSLDQSPFSGMNIRYFPSADPDGLYRFVSRVVPKSVAVGRFYGGLLFVGVDADVERVLSVAGLLERRVERVNYFYRMRSLNPDRCVELLDDRSASAPASPAPVSVAAVQDPLMLDRELGLLPAVPGPVLRVNAVPGGCLLRGSAEQIADAVDVLRLVDRAPSRVIIESTLFEATIGDAFKLGVRGLLDTGVLNGRLQARWSDTTDLSSIVHQAGAVGLAAYSGQSISAVLDAVRQRTKVEVLSSPTLWVDVGKKGEFQSGDQVPVISQTASGLDTNRVVSNVEYRNVGVILRVEPVALDGDQLSIKVVQEVSDASRTTTSGIDSPTISRRAVETEISVRAGQTVLLGGLLREQLQGVRDGIPLLSDLPLLGDVFSLRSQAVETRELALLMTPRIVDDAAIASAAQHVLDRIGRLRAQGVGL